MFTRQGFGPAILLLLLTTHAAADYMYGYVNQIEDNHFSSRTRFFPEVGFDITDQTEFRCHKERLLFKTLRVGDLVDVDFRSTRHKRDAVRVKIRAQKQDCSSRFAVAGWSIASVNFRRANSVLRKGALRQGGVGRCHRKRC